MMPIALAAFGEPAAIGLVSGGIEQLPRRPVPGNPIALEITDVGARTAPGERIRLTTRALTMALRARLLRRREAARLAARPRPNLLSRLWPPRERPPDFCAAFSACARKDFGLGERVERFRPGRMRKSQFPVMLGSQSVES
jgi:hypothetical protein